MRHIPTVFTRLTLAASVGLLAAGSTARADVTHAEWNSPTDFYFHVNYMPDLDQDRFGLPDNGRMFCVPTATMNIFAYAADWGFEDVEPGPGVWQGDIGHLAMTQQLDDLGVLMETGTTGTNYLNWFSGAETWLAGHPFSRAMLFKSDEWCPTLSDAAVYTKLGGLVAVVYGRYNFNPGPEPVIGTRNGGHCVTIVHMRNDGTSEELWTRDPGDGGSLFTEKPWALKMYDSVETRSVLQDWDDDSAYHPVDVTILQYDPDGSQIRFIDKIYVIRPLVGWSWSTVELNVVHFAGDFQWAPTVIPSHLPVPGSLFVDVANHPDSHLYLTLQLAAGQPTQLVAIDKISGTATRLGSGYAGATDFVVGRHRQLYVLAGTSVHRVDLDGRILNTATMPFPGDAIAYRDTTDEVIVVSTSSRTMTIFPRSLIGSDEEPVFEYALHQAIPPSVKPSIAVNERTGAVAILVPETDLLVHGVRVLQPGGALEYAATVMPEPARSVAIDDHDHLIVATEASNVLEYAPSGTCWWCWTPVAGGLYADLHPTGVYNMMRSRTNYDARINADDDDTIPSEELLDIGHSVPDCAGDLDFDGQVAFSDLLAILAAWGPCDECPEDLDESGAVGFGDILVVLAGWGPCPIP